MQVKERILKNKILIDILIIFDNFLRRHLVMKRTCYRVNSVVENYI